MRPPVLSAQAVLGAEGARTPSEGGAGAAQGDDPAGRDHHDVRTAAGENAPSPGQQHGTKRVRGGDLPPPRQRLSALLVTHSYFSFGAGTASPTSLVKRAAELGYRYVGLADDLNVTGGVELFHAAHEHGVKALIGATVPVRVEDDVYPLVLIAASRSGYETL